MGNAECREVIDRNCRKLCLSEKREWAQGRGHFTRDGLKGAIVHTSTEEAAIVAFFDTDDPTGDYMNLARGAARVVMPDGVWKRVGNRVAQKSMRALELPFNEVGKMAVCGTMTDGGLFKIIEATDPRRYTVVTKGALQGAKAHPVGQSRRIDADPAKPFALYKKDMKRHDEKLVHAVAWMMAEAERRYDEDSLLTASQLSGDQFTLVVIPAASRPFELRYEKGPDKEKSLRWIDDRVVECIQNGTWNIPNFEGLEAPAAGRIKKVYENNVLLVTDEGADITITGDSPFVGAHVRRLTGVAGCPPVVAVVEEGQRVEKGECLFGPFEPGPVESNELTKLVAEAVGDGNSTQLYKTLRQVRAWALLAQARNLNGRMALPIEGVTPAKLDQVYMQLKTDAGEDIRVQRIILNQGPRGVLRVPEDDSAIGFRMDLYSQSQNAEMRRSIRARAPKD